MWLLDFIYSFAINLCDENLPSFAVSTLVSFFREHSPNAERFIFPLLQTRLNPKKTLACLSVGPPISFIWVGALSGKRGFDTMRVEMTFLWMSEVCGRVDGVHPFVSFVSSTAIGL